MSLSVAILAGGLATRLRPRTDRLPKALLQVAGKPFIEHQLALLRRNGYGRIVLCLGYLGEMVQDALGSQGTGMQLIYVFDGERLLGTGGALRKALPHLGQAFMVLYGDSYLDCDYAAVEEAFNQSGKAGLMTVFRNWNHWDRSNVLFQDGRIVRYDKCQPTADMQHIDYGLGCLRAEVLAAYPEGTSLELSKIYTDLLAANELAGYEMMQRFYEIGSPSGLEETEQYLLAKGQAV
jgi:MurNAc alpha-1-phosphate uridylyltransferase